MRAARMRCCGAIGTAVVGVTTLVSLLAEPLPVTASTRERQSQRGVLRIAADDQIRRTLNLIWYEPGGTVQRVPIEVWPAASHRHEWFVSFDCRPGVYVLHAADLVSLPIRIDQATCTVTHAVSLSPAAAIRGTAVTTGGGSGGLPVIPFSVRRCAVSGPEGDLGEYRAIRNRDNTFTAVLPAGCLEAVARPPGFAPVPLPSMTLAFRETRDVGRLVLRPGATLHVRARSGNDQPMPGVRVWVVPVARLEPVIDALVANQTPASGYEGVTDQHGAVAFVGVTPEAMCLVARVRGRTDFAGPVELRSGEVVSPRPLVPAPGGGVRVAIAGNAGWLGRDEHLAVLAHPQVCGRWLPSALVRLDFGETPEVVLPLPFAGRWQVDLGVFAEGRGSGLDSQEVDVPPQGEVAVAFWVGRQTYEGRVLVGDRPVPGELTLARDAAGSSGRYTAKVDTDGRFRVWLPGPGRYRARFREATGTMAFSRAVAQFGLDVETTIRFEVASLVSGVVVRSDGSPVAGAVVTAFPGLDVLEGDPMPPFAPRVRTDLSGRFAFERLEYGSWELRATWNDRAAKPQKIVVDANGPAMPIQLVFVDSPDTLTIRLVDATGQPVPAARGIFAVVTGDANIMPPGSVFTTDADGYSTLTVGAYRDHPLLLEVTAPGRPLTAVRVQPTPDRAAVVTMPAGGGALRLTLPPEDPQSGGTAPRYGQCVLVNDGDGLLALGAAVDLFGATVVKESGATTITIPLLAAGRWRLECFPDAQATVAYVAGVGALPVTREFTLAPGTNLAIDVR